MALILSCKKVGNILASRRFATGLLVLLAGLLILGSLVPDPQLLTERETTQLQARAPWLLELGRRLNVPALTGSLPLLFFSFFLFLSTATCTVRRLRPRWKGTGSVRGMRFRAEVRFQVEQEVEETRRALAGRLRARGWKVEERTGEEEGRFRIEGSKGMVGFWGSILFHLGLLVVLVAVAVTRLMGFQGGLLLSQGFEATLDETGLIRVHQRPALSGRLPGSRLWLEEFFPVYQGDQHPVDFAALLQVEGEEGKRRPEWVRVNRPLRHRGYQLTLERYGFCPLIVIRDRQGRARFDSYLNLVVFHPGQEDSFPVEELGLTVKTRFYPDFYWKGSQPGTRSVLPRNPVFSLSIQGGESFLRQGLLPRGERVRLGELSFEFPELRYWAYFGVTRDPGERVLALGFSLCVLGLAGHGVPGGRDHHLLRRGLHDQRPYEVAMRTRQGLGVASLKTLRYALKHRLARKGKDWTVASVEYSRAPGPGKDGRG